jgi:hypothetical protein
LLHLPNLLPQYTVMEKYFPYIRDNTFKTNEEYKIKLITQIGV